MKSLIPALIIAASLVALHQARSQPPAGSREEAMDRSAASTYEHLATAIIEIEATEDELVKSILLGYHAAAQRHLRAAVADEKGRSAHLEAAAKMITDIANEGDKRIQAIRQRLSKAGHTHNTDVVTKEDYMFINSKEKKALVALARQVSQMTAPASAEEIRKIQEEFSTVFDKAIAPE